MDTLPSLTCIKAVQIRETRCSHEVEMQSLIAFAASALFCLVVNGQTVGMNEADLCDCFAYIICDIKNIPGLRKVFNLYKPRAIENVMTTVRDGLQWPEAADNDETWDAISDRFCDNNDDDKIKFFALLGRQIADLWSKVCEEGDHEECEGFNMFGTEYIKFVNEYLGKGLCGTAAKLKSAMKLPAFG